MVLFDNLKSIDDKVRKMGFDWPNRLTIIDQAMSECVEVKNCLEEEESEERVEEEIGDLLLTALQFCFFSNLDPEKILKKSSEKFQHRIQALSAVMKQDGLSTLHGQSMCQIKRLWEQAKKIATHKP